MTGGKIEAEIREGQDEQCVFHTIHLDSLRNGRKPERHDAEKIVEWWVSHFLGELAADGLRIVYCTTVQKELSHFILHVGNYFRSGGYQVYFGCEERNNIMVITKPDCQATVVPDASA